MLDSHLNTVPSEQFKGTQSSKTRYMNVTGAAFVKIWYTKGVPFKNGIIKG